jgi:hypothetical protein
MKKVILIVLLLFSISGFSQPEKDSLLTKDLDLVMEKLKLMHYLDQVGMEYWTMANQEVREASNKTFPYYFTSQIVKNNPTSIDIKEYLGMDLKEFVPIKWKDFLSAVYEKNIVEFIALTKKYGYMSFERMRKFDLVGKLSGNAVFVIRTKTHDKEVKKLIKKEFKIGNMPETEYEHFKFFLQRKSVLIKEDVARFEKKTGNKMIFQGKEE